MSVLAEIDVNARRKPSTTRQALKQSSLFDFTASKHQPRVSSEPEDDGYTSAYESTRVHPSSTTALEGDERPLKKRLRRHVVATANDSSDEEGDVERILPSQRKVPSVINAATLLARRGLAPATSRSTLTRSRVNHSAYLNTFVSNDALDVYRITSEQDRTYAPPFAATFSNASLRGGKQLLAVSDEEGMVSFIDSSRNANEDRVHGRTTMKAHENAIFDVRWSADDTTLATASGDQTVGLTDVESQQAVGRLVGHLSSVKQIAYNPVNPSILATASRDGSIRIWDTREHKRGNGTQANHIRNAHVEAGKGKSVSRTPRSASRSVTSVVFLQQRDGLLASGGTADGIVKLWDLRKTHTKRANPVPVAASEDYTGGRGLSSLTQGGDGSRLHALAIDSSIITLDPIALSYDEHLPPSIRRSPLNENTSFYVRMAQSPCGRYIVSGSNRAEAMVWDMDAPASKAPIRLVGHRGEVGAVAWGNEMIATCGDDMQIRLWRPNLPMYQRCLADVEQRKWHWSGTWIKDTTTTQ